MVLAKTLESPLDFSKITPFNPKVNQPLTFIGKSVAEAEVPIIWPPDAKNWLFGKDPDAGKEWRQKEKGAAEDEMVQWNHPLSGHESEQTPGDSERSLGCCSPWGNEETDQLSDWTTRQQLFQALLPLGLKYTYKAKIWKKNNWLKN